MSGCFGLGNWDEWSEIVGAVQGFGNTMFFGLTDGLTAAAFNLTNVDPAHSHSDSLTMKAMPSR